MGFGGLLSNGYVVIKSYLRMIYDELFFFFAIWDQDYVIFFAISYMLQIKAGVILLMCV